MLALPVVGRHRGIIPNLLSDFNEFLVISEEDFPILFVDYPIGCRYNTTGVGNEVFGAGDLGGSQVHKKQALI